jgi:hypothetical protein
VEKQMVKKVSGDQSYVSYVLMKNKLNLKDQMPQSVPKNRWSECLISLRSSSVLIFEIISSGKEDEVRPTFASTPNIALYGVRLIPE